MPSPKSQKKGVADKIGRKVRASSFIVGETRDPAEVPRRPKTVPNLFSGIRSADIKIPPKLTKLLVNVTIQRSLGAVKLIVPLEVTVEELTAAALRQYVKEMRLPVLHSIDPSAFDLHYSQFSLESLKREEKVMNLGARNFFLCPNTAAIADSSSAASTRKGFPFNSWLKFIIHGLI